MNYEIVGSGKPVVFLHGFLESNSMWNYLPKMEGIQQLRIELPGHGKSKDSLGNLSMKQSAEFIIDLLDNLEIDVYDIVGHSMGGYVGLELKSNDPRASKLVLLNSNFWNDSTEKRKDRERIARIVRRNKDIFIYEAIPNLFLDPISNNNSVKSLIEEAQQMNSEAIASASIAMSTREDHTELVRQHRNEVLVLQGEHDNIVSLDDMESAMNGVNCGYKVLENCSHMAHIERPNEVSEILINILK